MATADMARIRSIKPEFWSDRKLARALSRDARLLYIGLWNHADEHARLLGDVRLIKGAIFPYDDDLDAVTVARLLAQVIDSGRAIAYEVDGDPYLWLPKLADHQRLEPGRVESRLPVPPATGQLDMFGDGNAPPCEPGANGSAPGADKSALARAVQVAGSREQVAGNTAARRADLSAPGDRFDEFWAVYPKRVGKGQAGKAWAKAIKLADPQVIIAAAAAFRDSPRRSPDFTKHPATWLNAQCWTDEDDDAAPAVQEVSPYTDWDDGTSGWSKTT